MTIDREKNSFVTKRDFVTWWVNGVPVKGWLPIENIGLKSKIVNRAVGRIEVNGRVVENTNGSNVRVSLDMAIPLTVFERCKVGDTVCVSCGTEIIEIPLSTDIIDITNRQSGEVLLNVSL